MASRPSAKSFILYKTFVFLAVVGQTRDADQLLEQHGSPIRRVAAYLRQQHPVDIKQLYRGMLVSPQTVPADRIAQPYGVNFVSFTEDLQAACWFADPHVSLADIVMQQKPDATGWIGEYTPKPREILFHYSWIDALQEPPGPNIYQLVINLLSSQGLPQQLLAEFKFHIEHQQEVILVPDISYSLKPVDDYDCLPSQQLDNRFIPRPDWVIAPAGLEQLGITPGNKLYISDARFYLKPAHCRGCRAPRVTSTFLFQGLPIRADKCDSCGYVWSVAEDDLRGNPIPELSLKEKQIIFTIWWLRRDLGHAYLDEIKQLTQKIMTQPELTKGLRRLQDFGYIDSRGSYILYPAGKDVAWEMVQQAKRYGRLPPRLRYES